MYEASLRLETLRDLVSGVRVTRYNITAIESEALQLRKLLEVIAYASLVSNREPYEEIKNDLAKDWHAERILKKIAKINADFYPVPLKDNQVVRHGYLTRKQFSTLYDKCGYILHAKNPFSKSSKNYLAFEKKVPEYIFRIESLIKNHRITLASKQVLVVTIPEANGTFIANVYGDPDST